jgi:hypothetical protein
MTPAEFKAQYPQFQEISDDVITRHLNDFLALYEGLDFKNRLDIAEGLYTAHWLTVESYIDKETDKDATPDEINQNMTVAEFKAKYPQFQETPDEVIVRYLMQLKSSIKKDSDKNSISDGFSKGTFLNSEKTPEFDVSFSTPEYLMKESSTEEIAKTVPSTALVAPIDKSFKPSLANAYLPSELYGQKFLYLVHADLYKSTIYGSKLVYLLYQVYQDDLSSRQLDEKLKEYELLKAEVERRKKAPLAILV